VWLIFHKRHTGRNTLEYSDALDEALCYGWVDSLVKRLDENRYTRRFTPRRAGSRWSQLNRKRYARLAAEGRLAPPGVARAPTDRGYDRRPRARRLRLPRYIETALRKDEKVWRLFQDLAPSYRRLYVGWIDSAKRDETRARRLEFAIGELAAGKKLGLK
jgi:uncharacterized protein YdeI (YjbR/CyaY-like superfamily)